MLTLGVMPGDYLVIGNNIKVYVVKNDGALKLAVDAPNDVKILRGRVYERMQSEGLLPPDNQDKLPKLNSEFELYKNKKYRTV